MGSASTRRKNLQKRRKRRLFATLAAEIQASVSARCDRHEGFFMAVYFPRSVSLLMARYSLSSGPQQEDAAWTPEREELELMRNEEQRQRTHDQWQKAVAESAAKFDKKRKILAQRQQLILALRQVKKHNKTMSGWMAAASADWCLAVEITFHSEPSQAQHFKSLGLSPQLVPSSMKAGIPDKNTLVIGYDDAKTLMAQGPLELHDHVASRMTKACGSTLPQMEVRFKNVSISADIAVKDKDDVKTELPTPERDDVKRPRVSCQEEHCEETDPEDSGAIGCKQVANVPPSLSPPIAIKNVCPLINGRSEGLKRVEQSRTRWTAWATLHALSELTFRFEYPSKSFNPETSRAPSFFVMKAGHPQDKDKPLTPVIEYGNAKTLMAQGPLELHDHVASRMTKACGGTLPQMEVRFKNVSISADIAVKDKDDVKTELPTLTNVVMKSVRGLVAKKHTVRKQILKNVSGVFKPGTMTLVLGQPGSGKSSLMKLLSGRFPQERNVSIDGEVTYNGSPVSEIRKVLPQLVSYVSQRDEHYPLLTVKETIEFAHASCGGDLAKYWDGGLVHGTSEENAEALKAVRAMYQHYPDLVVQQLGLENCQNTVVGDAMLRGVSGGERKRVTTGEMEFGNAYVKMMDEISTGLDSAATFDIISMQRSIAKKFHKTVVISLLQPSPEVFALFDNVLMMNEGRIVYNGPREKALSYFENLGFKCPPQRDVADFLMDLGTNKQLQYEVRTNGIPRSVREFSDAFEDSSLYGRLLIDLESSEYLDAVQDNAIRQPEFYQSFGASTLLLVKRQMIMMKREISGLISRLAMNTVMALLYGCVFYQVDPTDPQLTMGIIFEVSLCLSMALLAQVPGIIAARDVFYKQRRGNFFRTASYVLSYSVSQIPPILVESTVFSAIVYWMCGFVSSLWSFVLFVVILCLINISSGAFFFFLASAAPNINVVNPIASVIVEFFVLFGGFTITKGQIPDYLVWLYWANPIGWGIRALAVNQYTESRFDTCVYDGVDYCAKYGMKMGEYALSTYEVPSERYWLWYGMLFTVASYVFFMFCSFLALEYHRYESPEHVALDMEDSGLDSTSKDHFTKQDGYALAETPRDMLTRLETAVSVAPGHDKKFIPVTVAFMDLWYTVPDPTDSKKSIDLLKGISGYALPGTITALMGSSGAGKTTLMDVIAGRKTGGTVQGQILLNGHPATDLAIRRSTGYCEQMDVHSQSSTIREALTFSAFLRQGADVPDSYKYDSVNSCLELLDLTPIADQIIRGSSVEQMKRLTIGVELAAQPSVLFLDEPTSGLDARSAKLIMDGVRKVANSGRTIICTIHQPSAEVFQVFDTMLLLKRGGETVFTGELGENAQKMIDYFEAIDGVEKLRDNYNPASWMLDVIGAGVGKNNSNSTDFVAIFKSSAQFEQLQSNLARDGVSRPSPSIPALEYGDKRAATELTQMRILLLRFSNLYWRTASYNLTRFGVSLAMGLLTGITYLSTDYGTYAGINSGMGMVFSVMGFLGITMFNGMVPVASEERAVFYRERAAQTYNAFWYFFGSSVMEILYTFASTLLTMAVFYPVVGFTGVEAFFTFYIILTFYVLLQEYLAELVVFVSPNAEMAEILGMVVNLITFLLAGFSPPAAALPAGVKWIYHINPMTYAVAALAMVVFGDCDGNDSNAIGCKQVANVPPSLPDEITVKEYLQLNFGMKHSEIWRNFGILVAFVIFIRILTILAMRFLNFQKK
ncbi:hypothetical protein ON010_g1422 [Phytophthora cinnamomi]|nr:hypothetical protein ON010_g1422 [Phytophthora cinnamomi]